MLMNQTLKTCQMFKTQAIIHKKQLNQILKITLKLEKMVIKKIILMLIKII